MRIHASLIALALAGAVLAGCHTTQGKADNQPAANNAKSENKPAENKPPENKPDNTAKADNNKGDEFCLLPPEARPGDLNGKIAVGDQAPDFTLKDPKSGKQVKLSSFRGKTVLLFFWASWCPYCKAAFGHNGSMNLLTNDVAADADSSLVVIDIGTGSDDTAAKQQAFLKAKEINTVSTYDKDSKVEGLYGIRGVPTAVVLDKDGKVLTFGSYRPDEYAKPLIEYLRQSCIENPEGS